MNRREFIGGVVASLPVLSAQIDSHGELADHNISSEVTTPSLGSANNTIVPMLYGSVRPDTNLDKWFASIAGWKVRRWMSFPFSFHPRYDETLPNITPFLGDQLPEFKPYLHDDTMRPQEELLRQQARLCAKYGIEFWYLLPFPSFPVRDRETVERVAPYLFDSGHLKLTEPRLGEMLKAEIRALKTALPSLRGVNIWFAEGSGAFAPLSRTELEQSNAWQLPIVKAFDDAIREVQIDGIVFAHNGLLTVGARRNIYRMMAGFPDLDIMEDITWPEEDMLHPFLGYLPENDRRLLFENNSVDLNFLLDTEYTGQGVLPSVYPRWWKSSLCAAIDSGAKTAMGRTLFWDGGRTDVNFNRLNAYIFAHLCHDPNTDLRHLLGEAVREMCGAQVDEQLVNILWETEPVLRDIIGINGIDCLDHSAFPYPEDIDIVYTGVAPMKAIDDLFRPPGDILYPKLSDDLDHLRQWRWQNRTISMPEESYIAGKRRDVEWTRRIVAEVEELAASLAPTHRDLFIHGYQLMLVLAQGMELFVETADLHYQWAHAKTVDDKSAKSQFGQLAASFRALATAVPLNPFLYRERFTAFASFLQCDLPRISNECR